MSETETPKELIAFHFRHPLRAFHANFTPTFSLRATSFHMQIVRRTIYNLSAVPITICTALHSSGLLPFHETDRQRHGNPCFSHTEITEPTETFSKNKDGKDIDAFNNELNEFLMFFFKKFGGMKKSTYLCNTRFRRASHRTAYQGGPFLFIHVWNTPNPLSASPTNL